MARKSYSYDLNGNLASSTDRKGQVTTFTYDGLNRTKFAGFNTSVTGGSSSYESTISYSYDAGNRMTQAVNTCSTAAPGCVNGTITDAYDNLDRLTSETTAQGSISYAYDAADRETSMTVTGQSGVNYTYDNANRLTQISQSSSSTSFGYDNGSRRTSLTLPNNVVVSYTYDNDSRVTGITYQFGSGTLGNLSYAYDQLGRRTQVGGGFAGTGLPGAVSAATYDAANELTNWNGINLSYDANGNMLGDGSNAFTWNARNQVATLNNVSLQYDAFGRRVKNLVGTSFLYDGANAVQELSGTTVTANLLSGSIDEIFSRTDSSGAFVQLKDALGSTIALVDSGGNVDTSYTYDPYGDTSVTGTSNANEFQYTGRENESNGLYFYRARYYSPLLGRFISEDTLGFGGGVNFYAYATDEPTNFGDPLGLRDYNEQETLALLQQAYNQATAGRWGGLMNIRNNSQGGGPYDFGHDPNGVHQNDTWTRCGRKMDAWQFANYMAGFQGAAYDDYYFWTTGAIWAEAAVKFAGIYYHITGDTLAKNDPLDATGRPYINEGEYDGSNFHLRGRGCGCDFPRPGGGTDPYNQWVLSQGPH